jgi:ABC-type molybdate transport system ATPase subunit
MLYILSIKLSFKLKQKMKTNNKQFQVTAIQLINLELTITKLFTTEKYTIYTCLIARDVLWTVG